MNEYMIIYSDGTTLVVNADDVPSIVYMNDDIEWKGVISIIQI